MKLILTKPIAFVDIESTGAAPEKDRIIDLAICKLHPDMSRTYIQYRFHPGIPIPPASSAVHGILDADVLGCPSFQVHAKEVMQLLEGCDLGGYNSNRFDFPLLMNEFSRAGFTWDYRNFRLIDAGNIFMIQAPRTLSAAVKFFCGREMGGAHDAAADINATVDVFLAQMDRYPELPADLDELHLFCNYGKQLLDLSGKFTYDDQGRIVFNFGQYKGLVAEENVQYLDWMYYKADFPADTREVCERIYAGIQEKRKTVAALSSNGDDQPF